MYRSFTAANFNNCFIPRIFCGKKINTSKLETLQECALGLVFCDQNSTYDCVTSVLSIASNVWRLKFSSDCTNLIQHTEIVYWLTLWQILEIGRDMCHLYQPKFPTYTQGFRSFENSGSKLWNSWPHTIKNINDINEFKKNIIEWCHT